MRRCLVALAVASVLVSCVTVPTNASATSTATALPAAPSPSSATPSPAGATDIERAEAVRRVSALTAEVRRVDYADAKRVRWSDYEVVAHTGTAGVDDREVWIVAISGEITPAFARGDVYASAVFVVDARTNAVLGESAFGAIWSPFYGLIQEPGARRQEPTTQFPSAVGPNNNVACGVVQPGQIASGEGSGAVNLRPWLNAAYGVRPVFLLGLPNPPYGSYVCLRYQPGAPMAGFVSYVEPGSADYIPDAAFVPTSFALPMACEYAGPATALVNADEVAWKINCRSANASIRDLVGRTATAQGWTACGSGPSSASWSKQGRTVAVTEASAGGYPILTLRQSALCALQSATTAPVSGRLGTSLGPIALGMTAADLQRILGEPAQQTITHGQGGPELHYANGLIVRLVGVPTVPGPVRELIAQPPFDGATVEGVRIGSSLDDVRQLFSTFTSSATPSGQLQFSDAGATLYVRFDASGHVDLLVLSLRI